MAAALGRRAPRRIAMSAEVARPATVAAGAAAVTPGTPRIAAQISLGLTTPTVVEDPSGAELFSVRPRPLDAVLADAVDGAARAPAALMSRSVRETIFLAAAARAGLGDGDGPDAARALGDHPRLGRRGRARDRSTRATRSPRSCAWRASRSRSTGRWSRPTRRGSRAGAATGPPARPPTSSTASSPRTAAPASTTRTSSRFRAASSARRPAGCCSAAPGKREARRSLERLRGLLEDGAGEGR